ncbi:MAG: molybdopterin-dependent oxidoreductase, partial [Propionibacteriaceae bacterium]|nr:molybdopterin-dependent oxidoreductase [Propionibacteriaceae bacterium]
WRANLFGNSAKGSEYFLRHLLGAEDQVTSPEATPDKRPQSVVWRDQPGRGKLDLVTTLDFRMTGTALLSDIVLPAATWYEKADISTTDMHPFVHSFAAAVPPPWQARTDFQIFAQLADKVSELAAARLGVRTDVAPIPFITDTPDEMANPHGLVRDWKTGQVEPIPGRTMPKIVVTQRDYSQIGQKYRTVGPLMTKLGAATKGVTVNCDDPVAFLAERNGVAETGVGAGRPLIDTDVKLADAILAFSGTTNGTQAQLGFEALSQRTGRDLKHLYEENVGCRITYADTRVEPKPVFTSYEWSGSETGGRRYSAFTTNVEELKPWHTVTGRQQFYIDHDWMAELGELLPVYRPPLHLLAHAPAPASRAGGRQAEVIVRYLTPHSKWSIHSQYQDNPFMLALSRGGPVIWLSVPDAEQAGIKDNDWIEAYNNHGVITARAIVSHRIPAGLVYMYHSKDRNVDVPKTESTGRRGGTHNAVTRLYMKPSHLLGGYGQLSYGFNYYGPTGNQRDELTRIRRRSQEVEY